MLLKCAVERFAYPGEASGHLYHLNAIVRLVAGVLLNAQMATPAWIAGMCATCDTTSASPCPISCYIMLNLKSTVWFIAVIIDLEVNVTANIFHSWHAHIQQCLGAPHLR